MKQLDVYLTFEGNCEEALNFYKNCLSGEICSLQRFEEAPSEKPFADELKKRVMHSEFRAGEIYFMASDNMPDYPVTKGSQVTLSINQDDENEQTAIFNKLAEGAKITMPLQDTFWGARFGQLTDKFGIQWMFNCPKNQN